MPRQYPPLTVDEVRAILRALGFAPARQTGSHERWAHGRRARLVTVDVAVREFGMTLLKRMIE